LQCNVQIDIGIRADHVDDQGISFHVSSVNNRQVALATIFKQLNMLIWPISFIKKSKYGFNLLLNKSQKSIGNT
jgi:hypothetical protein